MFPRDFVRVGWCAGDIWLEIGVVSQRTDHFEVSEMLLVIDEQLQLLLFEWKTRAYPNWACFRCAFEDVTKINEQILGLVEAAQWVMSGQEEIDDFLAPPNHINDVLVPVKKETLREK